MPFLINGTDRRTEKTTRFVSNARSETLARLSADALGVDVASVQPLAERLPSDVNLDDPASKLKSLHNVDHDAALDLMPPTIQWGGDWKVVEPPVPPQLRLLAITCVLVGLAVMAFFGHDFVNGLQVRDAAMADLQALSRNVQSDYEMTFPHNRTRRDNDMLAYRAAITRYRIDGVFVFLGFMSFTAGCVTLRASHRQQRREELSNRDVA